MNQMGKRKIGRLAAGLVLVAGLSLPGFAAAQSNQWSTSGNNIYNNNSGNVGVGTQTPVSKFHLFSGDQTQFTIESSVGAATDTAIDLRANNRRWAFGINVFGVGQGKLSMFDVTALATRLVVDTNGNIGIGTTTPTTKLHIIGDLTVSGNIAAKYQDVAEWVPSTRRIPAGSVVTLDESRTNSVLASTVAYDTKVAGVVSAKPGLILGEADSSKVLVATTGRVKVKADARRSPIRIGDLLVTSGSEGVAMRSEPVIVSGIEMHRPGTLIGKALEALPSGEGEILVLLSLQ